MIRPSDQFRDQVDRSFWEYVEKMDGGSMTCKFCRRLFSQHTSISRIKLHLSGLKGRGVKICGQVPQDVQEAARAAIDDHPEKKLKTVAGSSNGVMAQQGDDLLESENTDVIMNDVENMENNSGRLEQPVAGARWCLDELVKIMECRQKTNQVVLPIFYDTNPSDVRKQTGSYAKAFDKHKKNFKGEMEKVKRWREALTKAADLSGRDLHNETNGYFKDRR